MNGCPYCTEGERFGKNWWCFEEWRSPWQSGDGAVANLDYDFGTWTLCIEDDLPDGSGRWVTWIPVEHCPKCGRKLTEYTEVEK